MMEESEWESLLVDVGLYPSAARVVATMPGISPFTIKIMTLI